MKISRIIGFILLSLCFSYLGALLSNILLGRNFAEFILVPSLILLSYSNKDFKTALKETIKSVEVIFVFWVLLFLFIIGIYTGEDASYVYADFRACFVFFFVIKFYSLKIWTFKNSDLIPIWILISFFDLIFVFARPTLLGMEFVKQPVSIIAPALLTAFYAKEKKILFSTIFLGVVIYDAVIGFFRNYYFIAVVIAIVYLIYLFNNLFTKGFKGFSLSLLIIIFIISVSPILYTYTYNYWTADDSRTIHSINRTQEFLDDPETETVRINSFEVPLIKFDEFILPQGLGWRNHVDKITTKYKEYQIMSTMDSTYFFLNYHFSFLITIIIMIYMFFKIYQINILNYKKRKLLFIRFLFLLIFFMSFFTQGIMLSTLQAAFIYGVLFSFIITKGTFFNEDPV